MNPLLDLARRVVIKCGEEDCGHATGDERHYKMEAYRHAAEVLEKIQTEPSPCGVSGHMMEDWETCKHRRVTRAALKKPGNFVDEVCDECGASRHHPSTTWSIPRTPGRCLKCSEIRTMKEKMLNYTFGSILTWLEDGGPFPASGLIESKFRAALEKRLRAAEESMRERAALSIDVPKAPHGECAGESCLSCRLAMAQMKIRALSTGDNPRCFCPDCGADLGRFCSNRIDMRRDGSKPVSRGWKEGQAVLVRAINTLIPGFTVETIFTSIESFTKDRDELREALRWTFARLDFQGMVVEGKGRLPDMYVKCRTLAYPPPRSGPLPVDDRETLVNEQRKDNGDRIDGITVLKNSLREGDEIISRLIKAHAELLKTWHERHLYIESTKDVADCSAPLCVEHRALLDQVRGKT